MMKCCNYSEYKQKQKQKNKEERKKFFRLNLVFILHISLFFSFFFYFSKIINWKTSMLELLSKSDYAWPRINDDRQDGMERLPDGMRDGEAKVVVASVDLVVAVDDAREPAGHENEGIEHQVGDGLFGEHLGRAGGGEGVVGDVEAAAAEGDADGGVAEEDDDKVGEQGGVEGEDAPHGARGGVVDPAAGRPQVCGGHGEGDEEERGG